MNCLKDNASGRVGVCAAKPNACGDHVRPRKYGATVEEAGSPRHDVSPEAGVVHFS